MNKRRKNNPWIYFTYTQLAPKSLYSYKSCGEYYVTEYVELVLGRMAVHTENFGLGCKVSMLCQVFNIFKIL